jgi:hypothetical protein
MLESNDPDGTIFNVIPTQPHLLGKSNLKANYKPSVSKPMVKIIYRYQTKRNVSFGVDDDGRHGIASSTPERETSYGAGMMVQGTSRDPLFSNTLSGGAVYLRLQDCI